MEFYGGTAEFRDTAGNPHHVSTEPFRDLQAEVRRHEEDQWRLVVSRTGGAIRFDGMLDSLLRWAREEGLLRGQRNRALDRPLRDMRDYVAHGAGDHLLMPGDSAQAISDAAEIINQLWGMTTPGGRLYPAPIPREVQLIGWSARGSVMVGQVGLSREGQPLEPQTAVDQIQSAMPGDDLADVTTSQKWVLLYVKRWLAAPLRLPGGTWRCGIAGPRKVQRCRPCWLTCSCITRSTCSWPGSSRAWNSSAMQTTRSCTARQNGKPAWCWPR